MPVDMRALRAGVRQGKARVACVGVATAALGLFLGSLHAAGIDPSTADLGLGMTVLLYGVAVSFVAIGVAMVGVAAFRSHPDAAALERVLRETPGEVVSAQRMVANRSSCHLSVMRVMKRGSNHLKRGTVGSAGNSTSGISVHPIVCHQRRRLTGRSNGTKTPGNCTA